MSPDRRCDARRLASHRRPHIAASRAESTLRARWDLQPAEARTGTRCGEAGSRRPAALSPG
eukprot:2544487-Rhodomonas_salina.1